MRLSGGVYRRTHAQLLERPRSLDPRPATHSALIGLFNVFGTYAVGVLEGQRMAKRHILAFIYFTRAVVISIFAGAAVADQRSYRRG